jgi:antitoxin YefM
MLTAIKQHVVVKKGGIIELSAPDLVEGSEIEVAAVLSDTLEERDDTTYLLSNPATRDRILRSLNNVERKVNLIEVTIEEED